MNTKIKNKIIEEAKKKPDEEVCGFILYDILGKSDIKPCENISKDKYNYFEINPVDYITLESYYNIFGIYHSHTGDDCEFTKVDEILANEYQIPIFMYNLKHNIWKEYLPEKLKFNLLGNPFSWGLFDCYTLVRHYYWKKYKFLIEDYDRDDSFNGIPDNKNDNKSIENRLIDYGFKQINDFEDGAVILTENRSYNFLHLGIYEQGYILDHKIGRLSEKNVSMFESSKCKIFKLV